MGNPWFRCYSDIADNYKLKMLAFEDRWHFIAILSCKSLGMLDGKRMDFVRRSVAIRLGLTVAELEEVVRRLAEVTLIDVKTLQPTGWSDRQFVSDNSTERVRKSRKNKENGNVTETEEKRFCNAPEAEAEAEAETEKTHSVASACAPTISDPPAEKPPQARASAAPPTPAGAVCIGLKALGYGDTNPHDAVLHALLEAGLTPAEIIAAGEQAKGQGKGFRWVLSAAEGRRRDAAAVKPLPTAGPPRASGSSRQQRIDDYAAQAAAARGDQDAHGNRGPQQRDITGEAVRVS